MAKTIDEIISECEVIANETEQGANTATRVGGAMQDIGEFAEQLKATADEMVGTNGDSDISVDWGEVSAGYWGLKNGSAGIVTDSANHCRTELYAVNEGETLYITVQDTIISASNFIAFSCYDNDNLPYDGTNWRINYKNANSKVSNGDGTTTYYFVVPSGCTLIGFSYRGDDAAIWHILRTEKSYSEELDEHIKSIASSVNSSVDSDSYYLKGMAETLLFPTSKKICILAAGQSNIDGRCAYADMPTEISSAQPITNCHYIKNSTGAFSDLEITGNWAFDLVTYYNLCKTANKEIYVIKYSKGGTSIDPLGDSTSHWTADYEKIAEGQSSLLKAFRNEYNYQFRTYGDAFSIRAILWHQGEGDRASLGTGCAERYYANLKNLIAYMRGLVGNQKLPFITGTISHNSAQYDATVEAAQLKIASEDPYYYLVDMSGATLLDAYHFDAECSEYFGKACYNLLIDAGVISADKLEITAPWES